MYELRGPDEPGMDYVGRRWVQCVLSVRLLELAEGLDAAHFDHWALIHDGHPGCLCLECGGWIDQDIVGSSPHAMVSE
jgi:hypothetical protein